MALLLLIANSAAAELYEPANVNSILFHKLIQVFCPQNAFLNPLRSVLTIFGGDTFVVGVTSFLWFQKGKFIGVMDGDGVLCRRLVMTLTGTGEI